jgi:hypothetical protein
MCPSRIGVIKMHHYHFEVVESASTGVGHRNYGVLPQKLCYSVAGRARDKF